MRNLTGHGLWKGCGLMMTGYEARKFWLRALERSYFGNVSINEKPQSSSRLCAI